MKTPNELAPASEPFNFAKNCQARSQIATAERGTELENPAVYEPGGNQLAALRRLERAGTADRARGKSDRGTEPSLTSNTGNDACSLTQPMAVLPVGSIF